MPEAGESVVTLARWLGHSSPAITLGYYAHFVPSGSSAGSVDDGTPPSPAGDRADGTPCEPTLEVERARYRMWWQRRPTREDRPALACRAQPAAPGAASRFPRSSWASRRSPPSAGHSPSWAAHCMTSCVTRPAAWHFLGPRPVDTPQILATRGAAKVTSNDCLRGQGDRAPGGGRDHREATDLRAALPDAGAAVLVTAAVFAFLYRGHGVR
ncbi:hypothetical protein GCM10010398_13640 [Streptomyces fimbriatus]